MKIAIYGPMCSGKTTVAKIIQSSNEQYKIYSFGQKIKDLALEKESIIILSINPNVIDEKKLAALESQAIDIFGKYLKSKVELEEKEMEILKYINEQNIQNKLISFKDITKQFNITKPTTRAKIGKLLALNLVLVEKKGRSKALKITSAGRRIIR